MSLSISAKIFSKSKRFCLQFQPYQIFERHFTQKEPKNAKKDRFHVKSLVTLVHNFCFWKKIFGKIYQMTRRSNTRCPIKFWTVICQKIWKFSTKILGTPGFFSSIFVKKIWNCDNFLPTHDFFLGKAAGIRATNLSHKGHHHWWSYYSS